MKLFKRLTALVLSVVMMLSMGVSAFATEGNTEYTWKSDKGANVLDENGFYNIQEGKKAYVALYLNGKKTLDTAGVATSSAPDIVECSVMTDSGYIRIKAKHQGTATMTYTSNGNSYTMEITVTERVLVNGVYRVDTIGNVTDEVIIDLSKGNIKNCVPGDYTRFALVLNNKVQDLSGAKVKVEDAEGETNTDPNEWIINNDSFVALRVPYDAKTGTQLIFNVDDRTFVFEVVNGSHVYTLQALVDGEWINVDDDFTITGDTTIRALCDGEPVELVNNGGRGTLHIRKEDLSVNDSITITANGIDGTVTLHPVTSNSDLYLYYGVSKVDDDEFLKQVGKAFLGKIHIGTIEGGSYTFSIDGTPVNNNTQTLTAEQLGTPMTIQLTDAEGKPVDHSQIVFGGVYKDVVVAENKESLSITPMGITLISYEVKDNSNTTLYTITLSLKYENSSAYFVIGQDGEGITEITVENLESIKLGLQYGYGINNYKTSEFTIFDSEGNDVTVRENNLVSCDAFDFTVSSSYGITLEFNQNVTPSGTYTLKFDRESEKLQAELKIIFDIPEIGYGLYDDAGKPMTSMPTGSATGNIVTQKTALKVWELRYGKPTGVTAQIKSVDNIIVKDTRNLVSDKDAAECLSIEQVEGAWFINTTPHKEGNYKASFDITLTNGTVKNFTVTYLVNSGAGSTSIVYNVGASDSIQSAIDKAVASSSQLISHNIVLQEGATYSEDLTLTVAGGHQAKIDIIGNGATLNGTITYNTPENYDKQEVVIRNLTIKAGADNTAVTIEEDTEELFLQNVTIDGAKVGISGLPMASETRNVTIRNCATALKPNGQMRDISRYVLREWNFIDNDVAIDLNNASGQFKIRDSQFNGNDKNIVADSTSCTVVNAAFNNYVHSVELGESIAEYFTLPTDVSNYFYSPYTSKSSKNRTATSDFYIDPAQMNGLIIDAEEAEQIVNTSNFKDKDIVINIVETIENETTGFTTSNAYATWNFGIDVTANAVAMDFTPRIDRKLSESSESIVKAEGVTVYQPVSFAHSGKLPATATVEVNKTVELSGKLYLYKVVDGKLVLQEEGVTYENGIYTFDRPTCSDYIITNTEIKDETGSNNNQNSSDNNNSQNNDSSTSTPSYNDYDDDDSTSSSDSSDYISSSEVKDKLNSTSKESVTLNVENRDQLSAKVFDELAKHPEKTLVLKGDGYTLSIKGKDVIHPLGKNTFDADIKSTSPHRNEIVALAGKDTDIQYIHSDFHGMLPGEMTLNIKVDNSLKGKVLNLYHYNDKLGNLELVADGIKVDKKGYAAFNIDHFSTYILTDAKLHTETPVSPEKANPSTGADDMVALAAAMALVSIAGAVALNHKR